MDPVAWGGRESKFIFYAGAAGYIVDESKVLNGALVSVATSGGGFLHKPRVLDLMGTMGLASRGIARLWFNIIDR